MTRSGLEGFGKRAAGERRGGHRGDRQRHGGVARAVAVRGPCDDRQPDPGEGDRPRACEDRQDRRRRTWRACMRPVHAGSLDAGRRRPNACADWSPGATRSSGIARGSRTRCMPSCTPTRRRGALMPTCSAGWPGLAGSASLCRMTSMPPSSRHVRELDRLARRSERLRSRDCEGALDDPAVRRLLTITGVNLTVAAGLVAAIGDIRRFSAPAEAGELLRPEPPCAPVGPRGGPSRADQQGRA